MSGGGGTTTSSTSQPWAGSVPYLTNLLGMATQNSQNPAAYYPGQTYVSPTQGQLGAWDTQLNYNDQVFGGANAPQFNQATGALSQQLSGTPNYANLQGAESAANQPLLDQLNNQIIPGLNSQATFLNNPTGGIKTLNNVLPQVEQRMSQNNEALTWGANQQAQQAQNQGLQNFGNIYSLGQQPGTTQSNFANFGANAQQQALQDQMNRFNYYQGLPQQTAQQYGSIVTPAAGLGQAGTSTTSNPQQGAQNLAALLTAISSFSDRRLKRDIEPLHAHTPGGIPLYRYRYLWDNDFEIGVMADEAEKIAPWAVGERAGFKTVNYAELI